MTRTLILSWEYPPLIEGGLARHVRKLSEALVERDVEVHVLTRGGEESPAEERSGGVAIHRIREPKRPTDLGEFVAWVERMNSDMLAAGVELGDRYSFDLVHGHDWLVANACDHLAKRFGAPLVTTIHATEHGRHQGWVDKHPQTYIHGVERWITNRSERVIACSHYMREQIADIFGVEEERISVIPNGIDPDDLQPQDPAELRRLRAEFAAPEEKLVLLIGIGFGAFFYSGGDWGHLGMANTGGACEGVAITTGGMAGFAAAMLGALWAYDGWNNITFLAGEVKNPSRNLPLALILGGFVVMGLYLFVNINYFHVLTPTEVASVPAASSVAAEVVKRLLGAGAVTLMAAAMMTSSFGALHASLLATARIPYALAKDGLIIKSLAHVSPRTHVPVRALMVQMFWACVVALSGSYDTITDYAIFALTLFYILVAGSIFLFRKRMPDAERPYRTWGYPFVPILFMSVSGWLIYQTIVNTPRQSAIGLGLILLGMPVYYLLNRSRTRTN